VRALKDAESGTAAEESQKKTAPEAERSLAIA
jgi:hypothetical protein